MILYMTAFWNPCPQFNLWILKPPLSSLVTSVLTLKIGLYLASLIVMGAQIMNLVFPLAVIN